MITFMKSLNNNIALALDEQDNEVVVMGTGIGFKKQKYDTIYEEDIKKVFKVYKNENIVKMLEEIPEHVLNLADCIVEYGVETFNLDLYPSIYLTLSDHLNMAMERAKRGSVAHNPLEYEIPHLYIEEYQVGKKALSIIAEKAQIILPESEAAFIALHFVNAQIEHAKMNDTMNLTYITREIVRIINDHFNIELSKQSASFSRFIVHLRFFLLRQEGLTNENDLDSTILNDSLNEILNTKYNQSYQCALKIKKFVEEKYGWDVSDNENVYLVLHIERMISSK